MTPKEAHAFAEEIYLQMVSAPVWRFTEDVIEGDATRTKTLFVITTAHVVSVCVRTAPMDPEFAYIELRLASGPCLEFARKMGLK